MLANKESLVMSGQLFMDAVRDNHAELLPIDSEHNAIFQCMPPNFEQGLDDVGVTRIFTNCIGRSLPFDSLGRIGTRYRPLKLAHTQIG